MRTQGRGAGVVAVIDANYRSRWFRRYPGRPSRVRLVCLPHAGGTATLFHGGAERLPHDVEMLAVQYPGRQERFAEPCIEDMAELATRITEALEPELAGPLVLFGHSLGAAVAYEVARRIEARHGSVPRRVLVSGRGAPHTERGGALHLLDDERLIASARRLGDLGSSAYDNPDLRPLLLPSLRGDYRLIERYRPGHPAPLRAPVTALGGDRDPGCAVAALESWAELTTSEFECQVFAGDHFYLVPAENELVEFVSRYL
ncbi:alpha/beta fold hydrolase [Streptomyces antimycoticus]|uniref:thioesterase II family protein n=1 Tax=Streptomyces antimycoticus TaxID=68175 RepID=UPI003420E624